MLVILANEGRSSPATPGDVLDPEDFAELVEAAADFGNRKINLIVKKAGYLG